MTFGLDGRLSNVLAPEGLAAVHVDLAVVAKAEETMAVPRRETRAQGLDEALGESRRRICGQQLRRARRAVLLGRLVFREGHAVQGTDDCVGVEQLRLAHLRDAAVGIEQVVSQATHGVRLFDLCPIGLRVSQLGIILEDLTEVAGNEGFAPAKAEDLQLLVLPVLPHQSPQHQVRDALAELRPRDVAQHLRIVQTAHLLQFHFLRLAMVRNSRLLCLPNRLVHMAALATAHKIRTEGAVLAALPVDFVGDQVIVVQSGDQVPEVPCDNEVGVHVDAAVVVQQRISDHVRLRRIVFDPKVLLGHIRDPLADIRVVDEDRLVAQSMRMPHPRLQIKACEQRGAVAIFPQCEQLALLCRGSCGIIRTLESNLVCCRIAIDLAC
mmetsp:Transcript_92586/g.266253  ORF Transcript_92586/g.266253 Transcript_92586/m.266253 type:complete len:381 (+) Transcript_92586:582-1724(+)